MKPNGKFIRFVSQDEETYLKQVCPQIEVTRGEISIPKELPLWRFLWETQKEDYSDHDPDKGSDGGAYARYHRLFFFGRMNGKNLEICCLEKTTTSSDFTTDSNGRFCDQVIRQEILGIDESTAPSDALWIDVNRNNADFVVLDCVSSMVSVSEALAACSSQTASKHYESEDSVSDFRRRTSCSD